MSIEMDNVALAQHVEAITREVAALQAARAQNRRVRRLLLLGMIAFIGVTTFMFYNLGREFQSEQNLKRLFGAAERRLNSKTDVYMKEVQKLVDNSSPVLTKAFYEQAKKDLPGFLQAVEKEQDTLLDSLGVQLSDRLAGHYDKILKQHEAIVKNEFPTIKDDRLHAKMTHNLELAVPKLIKKYYLDEMTDQMLGLFDAWDQFPVVDPPGKGHPNLEDQFMASLWLLVNHKITRSPEGMTGR